MRQKLLNAIADFHSGGPEEGERILSSFLEALTAPTQEMREAAYCVVDQMFIMEHVGPKIDRMFVAMIQEIRDEADAGT